MLDAVLALVILAFWLSAGFLLSRSRSRMPLSRVEHYPKESRMADVTKLIDAAKKRAMPRTTK